MGCWAKKTYYKKIDRIPNIFGDHNLKNASAAITAASLIGIEEKNSIKALEKFSGVKRRLELIENKKFIVYDDFAHHPTAISSSIQAVKSIHPGKNIAVIFEIRSNSMIAGTHKKNFIKSFLDINELYIYCTKEITWLDENSNIEVHKDIKQIIQKLNDNTDNVDIVIVMSNGNTNDILEQLK